MLPGLCPKVLPWKCARLAQKMWVFFTKASPFDWNRYTTMPEAVQLTQWEHGSPQGQREHKRGRQSIKLQQYKESLSMHSTKTIMHISAASALAASTPQPGPALLCQHLPHSPLCHPLPHCPLCHPCWHRKMDTAFCPGKSNALSLPHIWGHAPSSLQQPAKIRALNMHKSVEERIELGYHVTLQKMEIGKKVLTTPYCCLLCDPWSLQGAGLNSSFGLLKAQLI